MSDYGRASNPSGSTEDRFSVGALVSGILAVVLGFFCVLAVPTGILAIVLGIRGRRASAELGKGSGIATAGIALGAVAIALTVIFLAWTMIFKNAPS